MNRKITLNINKLSKAVLGATLISASLALCGFGTSPTQKILSQANNLNPKVLNLGIKAYNHARSMGLDQKGILTIIDYSMPSTMRRLWVINMNNDTVLSHNLVAHGKNSGGDYAKHFSDQDRSLETSIGVYETGHTYIGKHDFSLRLKGLEKGFNDQAYKRAIVMHSAWYVSHKFAAEHGRLGRSWGCPALSKNSYRKVINDVKDGTIIMAYYPNQNWLQHSAFIA